MKYVFEDGKPNAPSWTIVLTATFMTASSPTPPAPSQRATTMPARTLLTTINTLTAKVQATLSENRVVEEFAAGAPLIGPVTIISDRSSVHTTRSNSTKPTNENPSLLSCCDVR